MNEQDDLTQAVEHERVKWKDLKDQRMCGGIDKAEGVDL